MDYKTRERRQAVSISVRYRGAAAWADAQIVNVSSRGVMALCQSPPSRGSYVEIRRGSYVIVGCVAWSATDRFGMRARDRIEAAELVAAGDAIPSGAERRKSPRSLGRSPNVSAKDGTSSKAARRADLADREAASARFARGFGFIAIVVVAAGLALVAARIAASALGNSLEAVDVALEQR